MASYMQEKQAKIDAFNKWKEEQRASGSFDVIMNNAPAGIAPLEYLAKHCANYAVQFIGLRYEKSVFTRNMIKALKMMQWQNDYSDFERLYIAEYSMRSK